MPDNSPSQTAPRAAVFFDRDNTLIVADDYLGDPEKVLLMDGAAACVAGVRGLGFAVVTASNQSGVARGYYTENDVRAVDARMDGLLWSGDRGAKIDRHEFCPHHPTHGVAPYRRDCDCRKPKDGMLRAAAGAMGIDLEKSWCVGDAPRDVEAGKAAGCRTILLSVEGVPPSPAASAGPAATPDFRAGSLAEVLEIVRRETRGEEEAFPEAVDVQAEAKATAGEPAARVLATLGGGGDPVRPKVVIGSRAGEAGGATRKLAAGGTVVPTPEQLQQSVAERAQRLRERFGAIREQAAMSNGQGDDPANENPTGEAALADGSGDEAPEPNPVAEATSPAQEAKDPAPAPRIARVPGGPMSHADDARPKPPERPAPLPTSTPAAPAALTAEQITAAATTAAVAAAKSVTDAALDKVRREREAHADDFSLLRLLAGVAQILAVGAAVWAVLGDLSPARLLMAVFLQLLALTLVMGSRTGV